MRLDSPLSGISAQHRIGAPLVFERLWQESGCRAVIETLLQDRQFDVPLERALFVTVLQRLLAPGSDRACERWHQAYRITELEAHEIDYILGTRERRDKEIREQVLADEGAFVPLSLPKAGGGSTEIEAKEVVITGFDPATAPRRYIVCRSPDRAEHDAALREAVLDSLRRQLKRGEKALIGNKGYRRYLERAGEGRFQIKDDLVAEDARYDGLYVLRTNTALPLLEVAIRYRELWKVETIWLCIGVQV